MVLKKDDQGGELCRVTDSGQDSDLDGDGSQMRNKQVAANQSKVSRGMDLCSNSENTEIVTEGRDSNKSCESEDKEMIQRLQTNLTTTDDQAFTRPSLVSDQIGLGYSCDGSMSRRCDNDVDVVCSNKDEDDTDDKLVEAIKPSKPTDPGASPDEDVDEFEVEEEDVKVCDICGDTGREDLLAVCSRCSDGAEHTYCMREMLDKVPEGDWLCEECKLNEELEEQKQERSKTLGNIDKSRPLGRTSLVNHDLTSRLDNDAPCEKSRSQNGSLNKFVPSKRPVETFEAGPTAKRQALESRLGSPIRSSYSGSVLGKDSSFKNLDKAKVKLANQISGGNDSTSDSSENARSPSSSLHTSKGNFLKSNSFSSANSKPIVKAPDEGSQKQKQGFDAKDVPGRLIGKSMSFKGVSRSMASEPKVKMLSPNCAPVQDLKGPKQGRDRNVFERRNTIKVDHPVNSQVAAISSKRSLRGDNSLISSVGNSRDYKHAQSDAKLSSSKHAFQLNHKSSDTTGNSAELRRLSSNSVSSPAPASVKGASGSGESKPSHISLKEVPALTSCRMADRSSLGVNGSKSDFLDSLGDKSTENSSGRSRQGGNVAAQAAQISSRRGFSDASASRAKEGIREENKLKAAIEAAMQKKQDIFRKNKTTERPHEGNDGGYAISCQARDFVTEDGVHEGERVLRDHRLNLCCVNGSVDPVICNGESVVTASVVPEQESVWQGAFEIHRSGKLRDMCGGFQAHLSSFASEKVLEVAKKLPQKIVLEEVPRPCAWPLQFKEVGACEDNIGLYFFAADFESYMRSYKILLDYIMKHDIALRGNINGVELLIFPSTHLPDKAQCWNTLLYMWGVFRGKRSNYPDRRPGSVEKPEATSSKMVLPGEDDVLIVNSSDRPYLHTPPVGDPPPVTIANPSRDCYNMDSRAGRTCMNLQTQKENFLRRPDNRSLDSCVEECKQSTSVALKDHCYEVANLVKQEQSKEFVDRSNHLSEPIKTTSYNMLDKDDNSSHPYNAIVHKNGGGGGVSSEEYKVLGCVNVNLDRLKCENSFKQEDMCMEDMKMDGVEVKLDNGVKLEAEEMDVTDKNSTVQLKSEICKREERYVDINVSADDYVDGFDSQQLSPKRYSPEDSTPSISQGASVTACLRRDWLDKNDSFEGEDQASASKRIKGVDALNSSHSYRFPVSDSFGSQMHAVSTSSHVEDVPNKYDDKKSTTVNLSSAERCFFLCDSDAQITRLWDKPGTLADKEHRLPDRSPNLELALGVEKKQMRKEVLPSFDGAVDDNDPDRPPDVAAKEENEDPSASLSLSLAFPFSDKEIQARPVKPPANVDQAFPGGHENTSFRLFRGSLGK